nr:hypothetical protein [Actinospica acidiphila]
MRATEDTSSWLSAVDTMAASTAISMIPAIHGSSSRRLSAM